MALYKTLKINAACTVYVWKIQETENELSKDIELTAYSKGRLSKMKSELHRQGFLSIRHLMAVAGYVDADMFYDDIGKPHLKDGTKISITHSHHFTAIIISDSVNVGIDIEMHREKILRIAHKFTAIEEYKTIANSEALIRKLTYVWGAKEAIYKIEEQEGLSFLYHIHINDFSMEDLKTTGEVLFDGGRHLYDVSFLEFEGFGCVYALKN